MESYCEKNDTDCPIVGIGASAGGLAAFKEFIEAMPDDSGLAFVLVQHLDPNHQNLMAHLLGKHTDMTVVQAEHGMHLEPDHVYMIPPNAFITLSGSILKLEGRKPVQGVNRPVDHFFSSLAASRGAQAIAVVLSGTGADGTQGCSAIQEAGGYTLAQTPGSAAFSGMPENAISAGVVDAVLPITSMPENILARVNSTDFQQGNDHRSPETSDDDSAFREVLSLLQMYTDHDFRWHKEGTLRRRIQRRVDSRALSSLSEYLTVLRKDKDERELLFSDLLIKVTDFFRDAEAWHKLRSEVLAPLVARVSSGTVRVWVPGCSTGEEAYSLAILLLEELHKQGKNLDVKIFATDLDANSIAIARQGSYPASIQESVPPDILDAYFSRSEDGSFSVQKKLRQTIIFAVHNVISDACFSNLHLISCRNLLIYLDAAVQRNLLQMFHFALAPDGFLFLGASETVPRDAFLFEPLSVQWKIYKRLKTEGAFRPAPLTSMPPGGLRQNFASHRAPTPVSDITQRAMINRFVPASVVINKKFEVIFFHGQLRDYLTFPTGEPTHNLLALCEPGLRSPIRDAVTAAIHSGGPQRLTATRAVQGGRSVPLEIFAEPLPMGRDSQTAILISFREQEENYTGGNRDRSMGELQDAEENPAATGHTSAEVERLVHELLLTRETQQGSVEDLETSNEELKAANEEVMSMNEELQSANEELKTSREELNFLNQKLSTVNDKLERNIQELEATNNDLLNLLDSAEIATIFLDTSLVIRRFTPIAKDLLHVIDSDVGRSIRDLAPQFHDPRLYQDARAVLKKLVPIQREVMLQSDASCEDAQHDQDPDSSDAGTQCLWFIRKILPYRTGDGRVEGVVITFTDVTSLKKSHADLKKQQEFAATIADLGTLVHSAPSLQQFFDEVVTQVNQKLQNDCTKILYLLPSEDALLLQSGVGWNDGLVGTATVGSKERSQAGYTLLNRGPIVVSDLQSDTRFRGPSLLFDHNIRSGMSVIIGPNDNPWGILGTHSRSAIEFDVHDIHFLQSAANLVWQAIQKQEKEKVLEESERRWKSALEGAGAGAWRLMLGSGEVWASERHHEIFGYQKDFKWSFEQFMKHVLPEDRELVRQGYQRAKESKADWDFECRIKRRNGELRWIRARGQQLEGASHSQDEMWGLVLDITEQKQLAENLEIAVSSLEEANTRKDRFMAMLGHELRNPLAAIASGCKLLRKKKLTPDLLTTVTSTLEREIRDMTALVNDLLDLSRITTGKITISRQMVSVAELCERAVQTARILISRRNQEISVQVPPDLYLFADAQRMLQVLENLISNASKYTQEQGSIRVMAREVQGEVVISVHDNGTGLRKEDYEKIFDPFVQLEHEGRAREGLGIGLNLVRDLVSRHGGRIEVESDGPDTGSCFTISLPAPPATRSDTKLPEKEEIAPTTFERAQRILFVEDNQALLNHFSVVLEDAGASVATAQNGTDAFSVLEKDSFDVVLTDIGLPDVSGHDIAKKVKEIAGDRSPIVIGMTGYAESKYHDDSPPPHFDFLFVKPATIEQIVAAVNAFSARDKNS